MEIVPKDLEAVLRPAKPDVLLLLRVEVVGGRKDRDTRDRRDSRMGGGLRLAMVLVAVPLASVPLQDALQDDRPRVGGVIVLRVRHNHEVGRALDVEGRRVIVQEHEDVPSERLWYCLLDHYSAPRVCGPSRPCGLCGLAVLCLLRVVLVAAGLLC